MFHFSPLLDENYISNIMEMSKHTGAPEK